MGVTEFKLWNYHGGKDEETTKYDNLYKENEMARIRMEQQRPE